MFNPIFIVGPHRAGSTLWHNLIAMDDTILRLPEPRFMGSPRQKDFRYFLETQVCDVSSDRNIEKLVELCLSRQPIPGLGGAMWKLEALGSRASDPSLHLAMSDRIKRSDRSLGAIARSIIEVLTDFTGCSRACVKFPVDVRYTRELMHWFPEGKVVHITRDPRGLAMSKSNDPSGTGPMVRKHPYLAWPIRKAAIAVVISQYRLSAKIHYRLQARDNYRLFHYEDLLVAPDQTLKELCQFVEMEFDEDMLAPERGKHEHQPSSLTGKQQKAFDVEAAVRWQRMISPLDNFLVTWSTRSSMRQLGYDPATHLIFREQGISPETTEYCQS